MRHRRGGRRIVYEETLRAFVELPALAELSRDVCEGTGSTLYPSYPDVMFRSLVGRVEAGNVTVEDLAAVLVSERDAFARYARRAILAAGLESPDQEFPQGYDPSTDDFSKLKRTLGVSRDFLVRHMVDYLVLSRDDGHLERYLAATRTPHLKQQAERLRKAFTGSR